MLSARFTLVLLALPFTISSTAIQHYTIGTNYIGFKKFKDVLIATVLKKILDTITQKDAAKISSYTADHLLKKIGKLGITTPLNNYAKIYTEGDIKSSWLVEAPNRSPKDPVMIYLHGGSYLLQIVGFQIRSMVSLYKLLQNDRLSILILDYSLTSKPGNSFPTQLDECTLLYENLVSEGCDNIHLIGDSAGGNAIIAMLRTIQEKNLPHPTSSILVSPMTNANPEYKGSYIENKKNDYITIKSEIDTTRHFCPDRQLAVNSIKVSPLRSSSKDWEDMDWMKANTLVIVGGKEVLLDDILGWAKIADIKQENIIIEPNGVHDTFFLFETNDDVGEFKKGYCASRISAFLKAYL